MLCFYCVFIIFTFYLLVHLSLLSFYCFYGFKFLFIFLASPSKHFVNSVFKKYYINDVYCCYLFRLEWLQSVRDQLFFSGFSSEVKPLSSQRTGSERQLPAGLSSEGAVWFSTESNLSTGDSEVRHHVLLIKVQCVEFSDIWWWSVILQLNTTPPPPPLPTLPNMKNNLWELQLS